MTAPTNRGEMGQYRNAVEVFLKKQITEPLPEPIVDIGGRAYRKWMQGIISQDFATWDMQAGDDVTRIVDATRMNEIESASVGTIICVSALEHVDRVWNAALQMARVTRPGGKIIISAPFEFEFHEQPRDYWRFTPDALRILFGVNYAETLCRFEDKRQSVFIGTRNPVKRDIEEVMRVANKITGLISDDEIRFLYNTAKLANPIGEFVELGTYQGRSCSVLCHVAAQYGKIPYTIDNYKYKLLAKPNITLHNLGAFGLSARILEQDTRKAVDTIKQVSVLYVDSDHFAKQFNAEMDTWLPLLVDGGIIICHDYGAEWKEMKPAIDARLAIGFGRVGLVERMIAFRKLKQ